MKQHLATIELAKQQALLRSPNYYILYRIKSGLANIQGRKSPPICRFFYNLLIILELVSKYDTYL